MTLCIQDPTDASSEYLIDTLIDACTGAISGAGAFAFMSTGGVRLFLQDSAFKEFAAKGNFDLIVGVDAITDTAAVTALDELRKTIPSLETCIHIPSHPRSIFHPKLAWFKKPKGGVLITGSGNLTAGGLRWNVEAFSVTYLTTPQIDEISAQWNSFKIRTAPNLLRTDDPRVVQLLERNAERRRKDKITKKEEKAALNVENLQEIPVDLLAADPINVDIVPTVTNTSEVLVAEIPQSGSRWKQANFSKEIFIDFFGASTTVARKAYFFQVKDDGTVADQEVRPAVVVASHNYRFELEAAAGIPYPAKGRPIGVFVKVAARTFTYMLKLPNDPEHAALDKLLDVAIPNPGARMRRVIFPASQVSAAWPTSPLWAQLSV